MSDIEISDDKDRLDIGRIHGWLASSYWSPGIARERVEKAIAGSHCVGAYRDGRQVGFARMITDHATFAWLADVWVDEAGRGQGLGRAMVQWFLDHPDFQGIRRLALSTRDAHGVYAKLGYHAPIRPDFYMERIDPAFLNTLKNSA
ncbi:GNAT family N-acetyltransferase [Sphingomonas sp. BIUV-7]|uniref:GNAT family N-acetyltransferase n=1 Tax=Sphingomonas natans TaxID=3063330 RepID=A0ABT8Y6D8_9SPHN|nr:GNAT family N-acetyltransferase [Sphingomonas sp. BIUV-7]MDO6413883.1 GNAT family N-acetyltransferase [Sphingomonas sp. BIUV-7]